MDSFAHLKTIKLDKPTFVSPLYKSERYILGIFSTQFSLWKLVIINNREERGKYYIYSGVVFRATKSNLGYLFILYFFIRPRIIQSEREFYNHKGRQGYSEILDFTNPISYRRFPLFFGLYNNTHAHKKIRIWKKKKHRPRILDLYLRDAVRRFIIVRNPVYQSKGGGLMRTSLLRSK